MRYKHEKGKAWKAFAAYIKARDDYRCITCGKEAFGRGMHAGHFIPVGLSGSNSALAWDEMNVHAQCQVCNVRLGGWGERYAEALEAKYGPKVVQTLRDRRQMVERIEMTWSDMTEKYQEKLKVIQDGESM